MRATAIVLATSAIALVAILLWKESKPSYPVSVAPQSSREAGQSQWEDTRVPDSSLREALKPSRESKPESAEDWSDGKLLDHLHATRALGKAQNWDGLGEALGVLFADVDHVRRLADLLMDSSLPAESRDDIEWLVETTLSVFGSMLSAVEQDQETSSKFASLLHEILANVGAYQEGSGKRVLALFSSSSVLDESFLSILATLRQVPDFATESALAVIRIAVKSSPPRYDLLNEFLDGEDPKLTMEALRAISNHYPEEGGERAMKFLAEGRFDERQRADLYLLVGAKAKGEKAIQFLADAAPKAEDVELIAAFHVMGSRGLGDLALDRYAEEKNPRVRRFLVLAGANQVPFLELAVDTDTDPETRGQALMLLSTKRPDSSTGHRILDQLNLNFSAQKKTLPGIQAAPLGSTLFSLKNWLKLSSPSVRKDPVFEEIRTALKQLISEPKDDPYMLETAKKNLELLESLK